MTERAAPDSAGSRIQILHVPGCPLADRVVALVRQCQEDSNDTTAIDVRVGPYPSPTLLIDGLDVTTGEPVAGAPRCRLDLPAREQIVQALAARR